MAERGGRRPTEAELEVLRVLWAEGPSTVREVHAALSGRRRTGYTTTLKFLQIMTEKGLVRRDGLRRPHRYAALPTEEETQGQLVDDLLRRAFGGSAHRLVMRALAQKRASEAEIAEIRRLLDEMGGKGP